MGKAKWGFICSMLIAGSLGLFVKGIPLSSAQIALVRGIVGSLFILAFSLLSGKRFSLARIGKNIVPLLLSGVALGFNWMLLFQAYRYTTIATATICYYFAPALVLFLSPFILKEKFDRVKVLCIFTAMAGMVCVAGVGGAGSGNVTGILYGLGAALAYAFIVLVNKRLIGISGVESALVQLFVSALTLFPYLLLTGETDFSGVSGRAIGLLAIVGVVHTGVMYLLYFSCLQKLEAQTAAVFSYIDPVSAILFAAVFLRERMQPLQIAGGLLVLGATLFYEVSAARKKGRDAADEPF